MHRRAFGHGPSLLRHRRDRTNDLELGSATSLDPRRRASALGPACRSRWGHGPRSRPRRRACAAERPAARPARGGPGGAGHADPRGPHAADRPHRDDRAAAGLRPGADPARLGRVRPGLRRAAPRPDRGSARLLAAGPRRRSPARGVRAARDPRGRARPLRGRGPRPERRARPPGRPGGAAAVARSRRGPHPGARAPRGQRRELHPRRARARPGPGPPPPGRRGRALDRGQRLRRGHPARAARAHLPSPRAGRSVARARAPGPRPRAPGGAPPRGGRRRQPGLRQRAGPRLPLLVHLPDLVGDGDRPAHGRGAPRPTGAGGLEPRGPPGPAPAPAPGPRAARARDLGRHGRAHPAAAPRGRPRLRSLRRRPEARRHGRPQPGERDGPGPGALAPAGGAHRVHPRPARRRPAQAGRAGRRAHPPAPGPDPGRRGAPSSPPPSRAG